MDPKCCCSSKILEDITTLKKCVNSMQERLEKFLDTFHKSVHLHQNESVKKTRRHIPNHLSDTRSSMTGRYSKSSDCRNI